MIPNEKYQRMNHSIDVIRITKSGSSSNRLGPCECCGKPMEAAWIQTGYHRYVKADGTIGLSQVGAKQFVHYACAFHSTRSPESPHAIYEFSRAG
jgi:hypothetical protein